MSTPLVSVIMNCHNGEQFLREAIDSIYEQTYQNWEIIFWDNASTDNSAAIAQSYDNRLRYYLSAGFTSLGMARELAVQKSNGEYVAFLDCDDFWHHSKLSMQMPLFFRHEDVGGFSISEQMKNFLGHFLESKGSNVRITKIDY